MKSWKRFWSTHWQYIVVLVFGIILSVGIWGRILQVMTGDDYAFHVTRMQSTTKGWANGQIIPQVDPGTLDGFGYAYNLFYGPLITYVVAGIQAIVGLWPLAINIALVSCVILAGLIMCRTMTKISKNPVLAMIIAAFYMASPYFLNNIYSRMAVGEIVAFVAAPILLLGLYQLLTRDKHAARSIAVSAALLVLSHSLSAMLFAMMAAVFVLLNLKRIVNWENIWRMVLGVAVALGLTAFFTLPMLEAKMVGIYGVFDEGYSEVYFGANPQSVNDHRLLPHQLMAVDYSASEDDGLDGENDLALGVIVWIGLLGFWFARKKIGRPEERSFVTSLYIVSVLAILAALPIIDWHWLPRIFWQMQFPWCSLMIVALAMSVVSGYTIYGFVRGLEEDKQKIAAVAVGMLAIYLVTPVIIPNPSRRLDTVEEVVDDPVTIGWEAEYAPMQLLCSPEVEEDKKQGYACSLSRIRERLAERGKNVEVLSGGILVEKAEKDGLRMRINVNNLGDTQAKIELPMIYYPGYEASLNGEKLTVGYSDENGLVTVIVPAKAKGEIEVDYGLSLATQLGATISAVTAGLGVIWILMSGVSDYLRRRKNGEELEFVESVQDVVDVEQNDPEMIAELEAEGHGNAVAIPLTVDPEVAAGMAEIEARIAEEKAHAESVMQPEVKAKKTVAKKTSKTSAKKATKKNSSTKTTKTSTSTSRSTAAKTTTKSSKPKATSRRSTTTRVRTLKSVEEEE